MPTSLRYRNSCMAIYEPFTSMTDEELKSVFQHPSIKYSIYQREKCPSTGRLHLQCYVEFDKQLGIKYIQDNIFLGNKVHLESRQAKTPQQAADYCRKKDSSCGDPIEYGVISAPGTRSDIRTIIQHVASGGDISTALEDHDFPIDTYVRNYRFFENAHLVLRNQPRNFKSKVIYLWGPTGTGKSRMAYEAGAKDVTISSSGFIMGYEHDDIVVFDDIEPGTFTRAQALKLFDRHPCTVNVKGMSNVQWNPKVIYLTSNFSPRTVFGDDEAIHRRIDEVHLIMKSAQADSEGHGIVLPVTSEQEPLSEANEVSAPPRDVETLPVKTPDGRFFNVRLNFRDIPERG